MAKTFGRVPVIPPTGNPGVDRGLQQLRRFLEEVAGSVYGGGGAITQHTHASTTQGGTVDHGALTGLADDDHPQYGAAWLGWRW